MTEALRSLDGQQIVWTPLPRQRAALSCPAFMVLYGGQKGGGKTDFLVVSSAPLLKRAHEKYLRTGRKQHRCRILIIRKNLKDLIDIIGRTKEIFPVLDPEMGESGYNSNDKVWTFTSGARVELVHLDGPDDHRGYNGQELRAVLFDQVEEVPYEQFAFLVAQVRTTDDDFRDLLMVRATANPGGLYGDWVYRFFISPHPPGNKLIEEHVEIRGGRTKTVTKAFVPATLRDNPYLDNDGQYEANLRATLPEHQIKQYLEGDWNVIVGAFFSSRLDVRKHTMTWAEFLERSPNGIPSSWDIGFGLDWGASAPAATVWGARDSNDRVWFFDELYMPGDTGSVYGEAMRRHVLGQDWSHERRWGLDDMYGVVDSEAWAKFGADGAAPADAIAAKGFRLFPANKDRKSGIEQILGRLRMRTDGLPGLVIIRDRCPNLWRTFTSARVDQKNTEDYDKRGEVHAVDAMRFKLMDWLLDLAPPVNPVDKEIQQWQALIEKQRRLREPNNGMTTGYE